MKACNFASLDPQQQARDITALSNTSRADRELWEAFSQDSETIAQSAEAAYAALIGEDRPERELTYVLPDGPTEKETFIKARRVQSFFRAAVLSSYENRCALTGLAISELLNASHIIPWHRDSTRRADPRNGICLNALHDRAFDRGLISFNEDLCVIVSSAIGTSEECEIHRRQLNEIAGRPLRFR